MINSNRKLLEVQWVIKDVDLDTYKMIAKWLSRHIKLQEMDFTAIHATIQDVGLSNRANNVLIANNITTLQQLLIVTSNAHEIRLLKGAGPAVTVEIEDKVLLFQNKHIFKRQKRPIVKRH